MILAPKPEVSGHTSSHHPFDITDLKETRPLPRNPLVPQIDFSWQKNEKLIACSGISSSTTPKTRYTPQAMGWQHGIRVLGGPKSRRTPQARVKHAHANVFPADRGSNPDALGCPVFVRSPVRSAHPRQTKRVRHQHQLTAGPQLRETRNRTSPSPSTPRTSSRCVRPHSRDRGSRAAPWRPAPPCRARPACWPASRPARRS